MQQCVKFAVNALSLAGDRGLITGAPGISCGDAKWCRSVLVVTSDFSKFEWPGLVDTSLPGEVRWPTRDTITPCHKQSLNEAITRLSRSHCTPGTKLEGA